VAVEAQVSGCPVVGFDVGGIKEAILPDQSGVVIEQVTAQHLAHNIGELLRQPERLKEMSKTAASHARARFSWTKVASQIIDLCEAQSTNLPRPVTKPIGFLTTWNQECGLALSARYILEEYPDNSFVVLAEESDSLTAEDEEF